MLFNGEKLGKIIIRVKKIVPNHLSFKNKKQKRKQYIFQKDLDVMPKGNTVILHTQKNFA